MPVQPEASPHQFPRVVGLFARHAWTASALVYAFLCLSKVAFIGAFPVPFVWGDSYLYSDRAYCFATTGVPQVHNYFGPDYPPLYSIFISPGYLFAQTPEGAHLLILLINILLGTSLVFPVFKLARLLFRASPLKAALTSALTALHPSAWGFTYSVMAENLFIPLLLWSCLAALRLSLRPTPWRGACLGAAVAAAILTKSLGLALLPALAAGLILSRTDRSRSLPIWVTTAAALLVPWAIWGLLDAAVLQVPVAFAEGYPVQRYLAVLMSSWSSASGFGSFAKIAAHQLAYLVMASLLLAVPAVFRLAELTREREARGFVFFLAASTVGLLSLSVLHSLVQYGSNPARYTLMPRYLDGIIVLAFAIGLADLLSKARRASRAFVAVAGLAALGSVLILPCVAFGIVDRMGLAWVDALQAFVPCRLALGAAGLAFFATVYIGRNLAAPALTVLIAGLIIPLADRHIIKAEKAMSAYHEQRMVLARAVADRIVPEGILIFDLRSTSVSDPHFRSLFWRILYQTRRKPVFLLSGYPFGFEGSRPVALVVPNCTRAPAGDWILKDHESCIAFFSAGEFPQVIDTIGGENQDR